MENKDARASLNTDIGVLVLLALLMMTYFFGLLPSLIANITFISIQALVMVYQYLNKTTAIPWQLSFWMIMPICLSLTIYFSTKNQIELQKSNSELRTAMIEQGAFDEQTHLRTMVAYIEDVAVFTETNKRFQLPVTTAIIKIRYYNDLKRMMSPGQLQELLKLVTETIKDMTRTNDITYLLNNEDPTWAILLFTDSQGTTIATNRIKNDFEKRLKNNVVLSNLAVSMVIGIASWNGESMNNPYDLMNAGIRETQYDV